MDIAGISVRNALVLELAIMLRRGDFSQTADLLEGCVAAGLPAAALTRNDRDALLSVLRDPPDSLGDLRAALV
jgi:hypothetical protein